MSDETEFSRRRALPYVQVQHMSTGRTFETVLSLGGRIIGSRVEMLKRGKVASVFFSLPSMECTP